MKYFDNDMDELFNRAGQDYPLNTDKKDWDAVYKTLQSDQPPAPKKSFINRYLRFLPLLLLLLVPVVFLLTTPADNGFRNSPLQQADAVNQPTNNTQKQPASAVTRTNAAETTVQPTASDDQKDTGHGIKNTGSSNETIPKIETGVTPGDRQSSSDKRTLKPQIKNESARLNLYPSESNETAGNSGIGNDRIVEKPTRIAVATDIEEKNMMRFDRQPLLALNGGTFDPSLLFRDREFSQGNGNGQPQASVREKKTALHSQGFYYGLKVGPDFTTIKGQRINRIGWAAGILAGYQFGAKWSIELSALWSKKQYYSDGKYFDKTKARIPSNVTIFYVDGGCDMIEVPLSVRYLFSRKSNSFFAGVGLNSFFMKKENYEYEADAGWGVYPGTKSYKNSGNHVAATVQLTGGYQFSASKKTNIRIEPYLQLPLQNVGIGSMPITSAGVHIGLTRSIR